MSCVWRILEGDLESGVEWSAWPVPGLWRGGGGAVPGLWSGVEWSGVEWSGVE